MNPEHPLPATCARVRERLDELVDGALPPLEAARDAGHLEACAACEARRRARTRWLADVRAALGPDAGLLRRANASLDGALEAERPAVRRLTPAGRHLAAAVLLAATALALLALVPELPGGDSAMRAWSAAALPDLAPGAPAITWPSQVPVPWEAR